MSAQAPSNDDEPSGLERWSTRGLPRRLGRYELMAEIGTGGMASVFLARTTGPGRFHKWVAVKRIHPHLAKDKKFVEMFLDEARLAAAIQHPNVAQVFDLGEEDDEYFLAMEYLEGEHLGTVASHLFTKRKARFPLALAARIVASAAHGLHHAHEAQDESGEPFGLVHRDVSPHNVFVSYSGDVKVMDFGVAKAAGRITSTETGGRKGKLAYMSPEQLLNENVDRRTDVFALGVVLWEISLARRLFRTDNDAQTITKILQGTVPPPTAVDPTYPVELEQIVLKCLARDPNDRFATAEALALELEQFEKRHDSANGLVAVSGLMKSLFTERMEQKKQMLRAATALGTTASSPGTTSARLSSMPLDLGPIEVTPAPSGVEVSHIAPSAPRRTSPVLLAAIVGVPVLLLAAAIGSWVAIQPAAVTPVAAPVAAGEAPVAPVVVAAPPSAPSIVATSPVVVAPAPLPLGADVPAVDERPHRDHARGDAPRAEPPVATAPVVPRPTTERRPPPPLAPAAVTTRIQILAMGAWAHVRIDGREVGQTPYNGEVTVGSHAIELVTEDGRTFTARHTASDGVLLRVTHRFE